MVPISITYGDLKAHASVVPIWGKNVWRVEFYFQGRCIKMTRVDSEQKADSLARRFCEHMEQFRIDDTIE